MIDPRFAPRRDDLPYLRRRTRPRSAASPSPAAAPPAAPSTPSPISFDRPDRTRQAPAPQQPPAPKISFDRPDRGRTTSSAAPPPPPAPPPPSSTSLDLDAPSAPPAPAAPAPSEPPRRHREDVRVQAGGRLILTVAQPTVTLTRLQSAIGTLTFEAACSDEVGDLRVGAAYQLRSGLTTTIQLTGGHRLAPPRSRRPLMIAAHERFGTIALDLRQSRELERLGLYAFSESRRPLAWGGTLIVETFGKARIELPLESLQGGDVAMLMSLYNVRGEFVLRAEMLALNGGVREACRAYGYDRITWLDDRTPVD